MQAHISALNRRVPEAIARTLHFPHYRLVDGKLKVWDGPESYFADFRKRAGSDWDHSAWGHLKLIHESADKVHLDVLVERFGKDGSKLIEFNSVWVIAKIHGVWAAQLRSSFAPDTQIIAGKASRP